MPFANIQRLANATVQSTNYFIDANVWIYALQGDTFLNRIQLAYSNFFYDIIESDLDPQPKVLMPTMLFSEILNTWLTKIAFSEYKKVKAIPEDNSFRYKHHYRPTQDYKDNYEKICDDVLSMRDSITFINDSSIVTNPPLYMTPVVDPFDFNDYLYYQICREFQRSSQITILTNDGDFQINDIPLITAHRDLLSLR